MSSKRHESRLSLAYLASPEPHPLILILCSWAIKTMSKFVFLRGSKLPAICHSAEKFSSTTGGLGDFEQVPIIFFAKWSRPVVSQAWRVSPHWRLKSGVISNGCRLCFDILYATHPCSLLELNAPRNNNIIICQSWLCILFLLL